MPVNLRSLDDMADLGNQFGLIFLSLPVGIADPVERLAELHRRSEALKRSAEPVVVYGILKLLGVVPPAVQRLVVGIFAAKTTAVMTNVPGPREELHARRPADPRDLLLGAAIGPGGARHQHLQLRRPRPSGARLGHRPGPRPRAASSQGFHAELAELAGRGLGQAQTGLAAGESRPS